MKSNSEIFQQVAELLNKDFHFQQFKENNHSLYNIIITAMNRSNKDLKAENKILRDDTDFKAMRNYAKKLERKLGIDPDKNK